MPLQVKHLRAMAKACVLGLPLWLLAEAIMRSGNYEWGTPLTVLISVLALFMVRLLYEHPKQTKMVYGTALASIFAFSLVLNHFSLLAHGWKIEPILWIGATILTLMLAKLANDMTLLTDESGDDIVKKRK